MSVADGTAIGGAVETIPGAGLYCGAGIGRPAQTHVPEIAVDIILGRNKIIPLLTVISIDLPGPVYLVGQVEPCGFKLTVVIIDIFITGIVGIIDLAVVPLQ